MKKYLFVLALALPVTGLAATADAIATCGSYEGLARQIMDNRQKGVSMKAAMGVTNGNQMAQALIMDAYKRRGYPVEPFRQMEINKFADHKYLVCLAAMDKV